MSATSFNNKAIATKMKTLLWYGQRDLRLEMIATPVPKAGEVLIAVERVGICGTDKQEFINGPLAIPVDSAPLNGSMAPLALGHEIVGRVAECPGGELEVGIRVIPDVVRGCGTCWWCERREEGLCPNLVVLGLQDQGGLAEYMVVDATRCVPIPSHVNVNDAAFAEPISVAVRALNKVRAETGRSIAVVGAGVIGSLVAQLAVYRGFKNPVLIDPVEFRRSLSKTFGFESFAPHDLNEVLKKTQNLGFDVVVECAGTQSSVTLACELVRSGGKVVLVGTGSKDMNIPIRHVVHSEISLSGSAAHMWDVDTSEAVKLLAEAQISVSPLITDIVPLSDALERGFMRLVDDDSVLKILIDCEH
jgi:(R,R)-butanediol dehydrogenase / meso-butanediol dehydrogenase / diacetyl reductase